MSLEPFRSQTHQQQQQPGQRFRIHEDIAPANHNNPGANIKAILDMHKEMINDRPPIDDYLRSNPRCHRFPHIVRYDHTRFEYPEQKDKFYHANWVGGYWKPKTYLLATAPHKMETLRNFWHMAVCVRPMAIVIMDDAPEQETAFPKQFWPHTGKAFNFNRSDGRTQWLEIVNVEQLGQSPDGSSEKFRFRLSRYLGRKTELAESTVYVMRPNQSDVPEYIPQLQAKLSRLRESLKKGAAVNRGYNRPTEDVVLLVCGDGVTKGGSFCVFDICMERAIDKNQVGLKETVEIVRRERYGTVSTFDQYKQLHNLLLPPITTMAHRED